MGDTLTTILAILTIASTLGAASGIFYGVRQNTIIATLKESNAAFKERNEQLDSEVTDLKAKALEQDSKLDTLLAIKSPDMNDLKKFIVRENAKLVRTVRASKS